MDFKVKCKKCGRMSKPEDFVLDAEYRMMVCPYCIKDRRMKADVYKELKEQKGQAQQVKEEKPPGWDKEDEYLEKAHHAKMRSTVQVAKISEDKVQYKCPKCQYNFTYNTVKKTPTSCPYCGSDIFRMRFGGM